MCHIVSDRKLPAEMKLLWSDCYEQLDQSQQFHYIIYLFQDATERTVKPADYYTDEELVLKYGADIVTEARLVFAVSASLVHSLFTRSIIHFSLAHLDHYSLNEND